MDRQEHREHLPGHELRLLMDRGSFQRGEHHAGGLQDHLREEREEEYWCCEVRASLQGQHFGIYCLEGLDELVVYRHYYRHFQPWYNRSEH